MMRPRDAPGKTMAVTFPRWPGWSVLRGSDGVGALSISPRLSGEPLDLHVFAKFPPQRDACAHERADDGHAVS